MELLQDLTCNNSNSSTFTTSTPLPYPSLLSKQVLQVAYAILAFVAIIGNGLVVTIIISYGGGKMLLSGNNLLIASMAIMDMMTGIIIYIMPTFVVPAEVYLYPNGIANLDVFCRIIASQYLLFYFGFGSVFTITAIAIERWIAISRPFSYRRIVTLKRVKIFIALLWFVCLFIPIDTILQIKYDPVRLPPCRWNSFFDRLSGKILFIFLQVIRVLLPILITLTCYADIARRLLYPSKIDILHQSDHRVTTFRNKIKWKFTFMSATAALVIISCWLPNEIYFTLLAFKLTAEYLSVIRGFKSLIILSSCLSPFIYSATNEEYRKGLRFVLFHIYRLITINWKCTKVYKRRSRNNETNNSITTLIAMS